MANPLQLQRANDLLMRGRAEEAVAACDAALALVATDPDAWTVMGRALHDLDRLDEAEAALRRALALRPAEVVRYNALAVILQLQGRSPEAVTILELALALDPNNPDTHLQLAEALLRVGRLAEGWKHYEWRFRTTRTKAVAESGFAARNSWRGESLEGRTIFLIQEQGLGDAIQFVRYAPLIVSRGGRVVIGVDPSLSRLLAGMPSIRKVITSGERVPTHDVHCHLLSLPHVFGTTLETIPANVPYLYAASDAAQNWADRLNERGSGLRVGVVWAGSADHQGDHRRSLQIHALAPLWQVPGVRWFSLQVGSRRSELNEIFSDCLPVGGIDDLGALVTDFADTAALIVALDLVISVDTSVAHLAGALGQQVWLLLTATSDWRWLMNGDSSPWYPTLRLFRQDKRRTWEPVLIEVADALHHYVEARHPSE